MAITVSANNRSVVHKASSAVTIAFPDVCTTPASGTPMGVPVPYPSFAATAVEKQKRRQTGAIATKTPTGQASSSAAAPAPSGVIANKILGKAEFVNYSFDVKYEGNAVVRHEVIQLHNRLDQVHAQLKHMTSLDPEFWQRLIQDYAVSVSALYTTLKDDD